MPQAKPRPRVNEKPESTRSNIAGAGFSVLTLLVVLWSSVAIAAEPKIINIGWTGGSSWTALPDRVASERGYYEKEGLRVRYIQFQGTNLMLGALLANELDYVTILPFIAGAERAACLSICS